MINLELLSEANIDAVRAIHREDIPVRWVDDADTLRELTQYGPECRMNFQKIPASAPKTALKLVWIISLFIFSQLYWPVFGI